LIVKRLGRIVPDERQAEETSGDEFPLSCRSTGQYGSKELRDEKACQVVVPFEKEEAEDVFIV
jgi:hypothetical protein